MHRLPIVLAALAGLALASPAPAQDGPDLGDAARENERLRQQTEAMKAQTQKAAARNEELRRLGEESQSALGEARERNEELARRMDAAAATEEVLKARFELEQLESRIRGLRDLRNETGARLSELQRRGEAGEVVGDRMQAEIQSLRQRLMVTEQRLDSAELERGGALLRIDQLQRLDALRRGPVVSLKFKGGTMTEYIAALRATLADTPLNVLLSPEAEDAPIPPITLESVTIDAALRAATEMGQQGGRAAWRMQTIAKGDSGTPVYRLEYITASNSPLVGGPSTQVQVFSISDLTGGAGERITPETLLGAAEVALGMSRADGAPGAEVKFHPDSGLLIVKGTESTLRIIHETVREIRNDLLRRRSEGKAAREEAINREAEMRKAELELATARERLQLERRLFESVEARQSVDATREDLLRAQASLGEVEAAVRRAELAMELTQQRYALNAQPSVPRGRAYEVKPGDTLEKIAERELGSGDRAAEILRMNPGLRKTDLPPGRKIVLPEGERPR